VEQAENRVWVTEDEVEELDQVFKAYETMLRKYEWNTQMSVTSPKDQINKSWI
jgi:hypothetical protein